MIQETLKKVAAGQDLTYDEAYASMDEIFSGQVPGETTAARCPGSCQIRNTGRELTAPRDLRGLWRTTDIWS